MKYPCSQYGNTKHKQAVLKGVSGGPSGPSREGPGVGHQIVSDTKQMKKERKKKKKMSGKREKCVKKKKWKKEREKNGQK